MIGCYRSALRWGDACCQDTDTNYYDQRAKINHTNKSFPVSNDSNQTQDAAIECEL
ncbi:MAG: hypothetical protein Pars92KO_26320 [Parasphingorhabdus sp.]